MTTTRCGIYPTAAGYHAYCPVCAALERADHDHYDPSSFDEQTWSDAVDAVFSRAIRAQRARRQYRRKKRG